ncbi:hypothetical protein ACHAWT_005416 [Skeletonema menzelii]
MPPSRLTSLAAAAAAASVVACSSIRQTSAFSITTSTSSCDVSSRSSSSFTSSPPTHHQIIFDHSSSSSAAARSSLTMKVSSKSKRNRSNKSSHLIELNNERLSTAGRPGTKSFIDPNKLFIGNLPYTATEDDIQQLFSDYWGVPLHVVEERIESIKVIRDWKTGQSKGFGFLQFYEPMVATSTMVGMNQAKNKKGGWKIMGRTVRLDQGKRNREEEEKEMQRRKKEKERKKKERMERAELDEEGRVIHDALVGVDGGGEVEKEEEDGMMSEDDMITFMEKGGLRGVMPLTMETAGFLGIEGMYEDDDDEDDEYYSEFYSDNGYNDEDWDGADLDEEDDGEDLENFVFDGDFEAEYNPNEYEALSEEEEAEMKQMNREQRRAAEKRRKKRKLPFKGFGTPN